MTVARHVRDMAAAECPNALGGNKRLRSPSMEELQHIATGKSKCIGPRKFSEITYGDGEDLPAPLELTEDLWTYLLTFVEDTDLRTLYHVNHLLQRLASDKILWRRYIQARNRHRVDCRLFEVPQRPTRNDLITWNILRTIPFRDASEVYINSPTRVTNHRNQEALRKLFIFKSLRKGLEARPKLHDLANRNVIPPAALQVHYHIPTISDTTETNSITPNIAIVGALIGTEVGEVNDGGDCCCSPKLVPKAVRLSKAFKEDHINRTLRQRLTIEDLRDSGLSKTHTVTKYCSYHPIRLATQLELAKNLASARINSNLTHRPSVQSLESMKVLRTDPATALMMCPSIRPKLRYFEDLSVNSVALTAEDIENLDNFT
ncbi:hypothetical protein DFS34DRAFT_453157 [Phlyctochytrium arcticum]|nr:hypothetical protein DFS34DRAFT_453157 [Phlyctochytrium arcticum]